MSEDQFDKKISIHLSQDEAIVLLFYLSRELWDEDEKNLRQSFVHPAEAHSLHALFQELIPPLTLDTGDPQKSGIEDAAREHLLQRHS
jgi:hypothetical protein